MTFPSLYISRLRAALDTIDDARIAQAIDWIRDVRDAGGTIFVCGNGGSAATASHFATDLVKGASYGSARRFRILALTDSISTLTAYANDVSYDSVFVEQLRNFVRPGDLVMGISGSGNSLNVVRALEYANSVECRTVALTGFDGGRLARTANLVIHVPEEQMGRVEDAHMVICHVICYAFIEGHVVEGG